MSSPLLYEGRQTTRLELAKHFLRNFVRGDGRELKGRSSDWVGVVAFARQPETVCPLTLAHDAIPGLVSRLRPAFRMNEVGTAIGDAVSLAAARLQQFPAKSRSMILLTDGENNAGVRNVWQATELAARWGIRVHAIGIVGSTPAANPSLPPGIQLRFASERDLAQLACGGIYRNAHDGEALRSIYAEIDRLEKSEIARTRYTNGRERFWPLVVASLILLALAELGAGTWLRRIP
jgi:Ca-activated chloride channel family protein